MAADIGIEYSRRADAFKSGSGLDQALDLLRFCRANHVGSPDLVLAAATKALGSSKLGGDHEYFTVLEQAIVAGLGAGGKSGEDAVKSHLPVLQKEFPGSARVARLRGLCHEAKGEFDKAVEVYDATLKTAPTHAPTLKRKVAALVGAGRDVDAVAELTQYCTMMSGDGEAWGELAELHVSLGRLPQAAFCLEEALLATPNNAALHARLAEVLAYTGSRDALRNARLHASEAVRLTTTTSSSGSGSSAPGDASNGWALTLLADVCFLHWAKGVGRRPAPGLCVLAKPGNGDIGWAGRSLPELAAAADEMSAPTSSSAPSDADASSSSSSSSASSSGDRSLASAVARDGSLLEDVALHCAAVEGLAALAKSHKQQQGGAGSTAAAPGRPLDAPREYPFARLHAACLREANLARLSSQADQMLKSASAATGN